MHFRSLLLPAHCALRCHMHVREALEGAHELTGVRGDTISLRGVRANHQDSHVDSRGHFDTKRDSKSWCCRAISSQDRESTYRLAVRLTSGRYSSLESRACVSVSAKAPGFSVL